MEKQREVENFFFLHFFTPLAKCVCVCFPLFLGYIER